MSARFSGHHEPLGLGLRGRDGAEYLGGLSDERPSPVDKTPGEPAIGANKGNRAGRTDPIILVFSSDRKPQLVFLAVSFAKTPKASYLPKQ